MAQVRFSSLASYFSILHSVQTDYEAYSNSYPMAMGVGGSDKAAEAEFSPPTNL
jgi:hypothetical protein